MQCTIFFNITPNARGGVHYAPAQKLTNGQWGEAWNTQLKQICAETSAPSKGGRSYRDEQINTYSFNDNWIEIGYMGAAILSSQYPTYLSVNISSNVYRFYFIDNIIPVGNGYRLTVTPDEWANYIAVADISNITVFKSTQKQPNTEIGIYTYEQFKAPTQGDKKRYYSRQTFTRKDLCLYAVVNYKALDTTNKSVESTALIQVPLYLYAADGSNPTNDELYELIDVVSNLYELTFSVGSSKYLSATISKLFLDINYPIGTRGSGVFHSITKAGTEKTVSFDVCSDGYLNENYYIVDRDYNGTLNANLHPILTIDHLTGYKVSVGVYGNMLDLPLFIGYMGITVTRIFSPNGISYKITAADNELDITNNFELQTTINHGELTTSEKVQKSLGVLSGVVGAGAQIASVATGNVTGAISGSLSLANTFASLKRNESGTKITQGNGITTFYGVIIGNTFLPASPIVVGVAVDDLEVGSGYPAHKETIEYIKKNGADCLYTVNNVTQQLEIDNGLERLYALSSIFGNISSNTYSYFKMSCEINNIPYDSAEAIAGEFNEGVKIIFIN